MSTYAMILIVIIAITIELLPMKKKQGKDIAALFMLGAITLAYGYYYITHAYTASIVNLLFELFNVR